MNAYFKSLLLITLMSCSNEENFEKYVNPLIGSDIRVVEGKDKNSTEERGQTIPAVGVPHGMTNWVAQTQNSERKCVPPYYYFQKRIEGFQASHWMNGSCTQNYGSVTIMPLSNRFEVNSEKRASTFSHDDEFASPSYYSVFLKDDNVLSELTGLSRSGIMRFSFNDKGDHYIIVEPNSDEGVAEISIDPENKLISGINPVHRIYQGFGKPAGFNGNFIVKIDAEFDNYGVWRDTIIYEGEKKIKGNGNNVGVWIKLKGNSKTVAKVKIGTSFTSIENADKNLSAEIPDWNFEKIRNKSSKIWNNTLGQIAVKGGSETELVKFYSALYDSRFLPRTFSDIDGAYPKFDGGETILNIAAGTYYCDFSQWDTYRAVHPLLSILDPDMNGEMANSLVLKAEQGGWLPIFPAWNSYTAAMIGDHCTAMIGDAIIKELPNIDYEAAYEVMRKNAFEINEDIDSYRNGKGRRAMDSYLKFNYIPLEDNVSDAFHKREQVSRTLEYAFDDFVLSQVAKKLGKMDDYEMLIARAKNYKNVIDPVSGYARGRYEDGGWAEKFDPFKQAPYICEGTPYHYTWYVPQDIAGLIEHIGGKERFTARLDTFFMDDYYWHGNEPGHHIAYLYAYVGEPWKTQKLIKEIIEKEYFTTPDGLSGNDDAGQMSAWLVFSMLGFYPVCPGMPYYLLGSPSFEDCVITLKSGKKFRIIAKNVSKESPYIQSAKLNGKDFNRAWIWHKEICDGGTLELIMGDKPNSNFGRNELPPSLGNY